MLLDILLCIKNTTNLVFGQFYFTGLQVDADWLAALQLVGGPGEPCAELVQCILELTQIQKSALQLMLGEGINTYEYTYMFFFSYRFFFLLFFFPK